MYLISYKHFFLLIGNERATVSMV